MSRPTDSSWRIRRDCYTDADGNYRIGGLTDWQLPSRVSPTAVTTDVLSEYYDDQPDLASATPIAVALGVDTPNIDAQLAKAGSISGTVTDSSGDPLRDICVYAYDSGDGFAGFTNSDANGNYRIGGLTTGDYRIGFYRLRQQRRRSASTTTTSRTWPPRPGSSTAWSRHLEHRRAARQGRIDLGHGHRQLR